MADSSHAWGPDSGQIHSMPWAIWVGNALALALSVLQAGSSADLPDCMHLHTLSICVCKLVGLCRVYSGLKSRGNVRLQGILVEIVKRVCKLAHTLRRE